MREQERLEPCFCGSGRSRTECCGLKGNRVLDFTDFKLGREIKEIRKELYEFLLYDLKVLEKGFAESVFSDYMDYSDLVFDNEYLELFLEWVVFSFKMEKGKTPFSRFLEEKKKTIRPGLYQELLRWKKSFLSAHRVKEILPGGTIILQDIFSADVNWLSCSQIPEVLEVGDVMIARLLAAGNWNVTFLDPLVFPDLVEKPLFQDLSGMRERMVGWGFSYKSWAEFLRNQEEIILTILCACFEESQREEENDGELDREMGLEIREFLNQPRTDLGHKSPRELSLSKVGRETLGLFFLRIDRGDYTWKGVNLSEFSGEIKTLLGANKKNQGEHSWEVESYFAEACLLARRMARYHFPKDIETALSFWEAYSLNKKPVFRKKGSWAAAIDYLVSRLIGYNETQNEVAKIYGVSLSSIGKKQGILTEFLAEEYKKASFSSRFTDEKGCFSDILWLFDQSRLNPFN